MLLSCCNGEDDGYKPSKNTCFSIIMPLSIKNVLDEKKKKSQETGPLELNFLLPEHRVHGILKNDSVIVFSFIFGIFYSNLFICMIRSEEVERGCSSQTSWPRLWLCHLPFGLYSSVVLRNHSIDQIKAKPPLLSHMQPGTSCGPASGYTHWGLKERSTGSLVQVPGSSIRMLSEGNSSPFSKWGLPCGQLPRIGSFFP